MTNIVELRDELDILKSQMEILTRSMANKNLITDDMIRQTVEERMDDIVPSKTMNYVSLVVSIIFFPALILWMTLVKDMYSLPLGIFTVVMSWTTAYRTYEGMRLNTMDIVSDGSVLEVTEAVNKMRQMNNRHKIFTYSILLVWVVWFMLENYSSMIGSIREIVLSFAVFTFVFAGLSTGFNRVERVTRQILRDIDNYRQ